MSAMAKFLKSLFQTTPDKRKISQYGTEHEALGDVTPPMGGRRKLSISRSGRMKQTNRKRHSISLDLYGEVRNSYQYYCALVSWLVLLSAKPKVVG